MTLNEISKGVEQEAADLVSGFVTDEQIKEAIEKTPDLYTDSYDQDEDGQHGVIHADKDEVLGIAEYLLEIHAPEGMTITNYDIANLAERVEKIAEDMKPTDAEYAGRND